MAFGFPGLDGLGYTGAGVAVAVVDSGVKSHPDLKATASFSVVGKTDDKYGHGNHVAGIVAGDGSHSNGPYHGVASGADIINVRVLDDFGAGRTSDVIAVVEWVMANKDQYGIRVVNLSLGHPVTEAAADDPLVQAVEALWDAGVVVVCSAGNDGREGYGTITSPGNSSKVITVGSVTHWGDAAADNDIVSTFSSRGPTRYDHFVKPDLVTPGNRMISIKAKDCYLQSQHPERLITAPGKATAEYYQLSGTSMSAAVVSGAVALLLEKDPTLDPDTVKARLMRSATKVPIGDPFATGAGVLDIAAALDEPGYPAAAPSPRAVRDLAPSRIGFENTGLTWGGLDWSMAFVFTDAFVWSDSFVFADDVMTGDGGLLDD